MTIKTFNQLISELQSRRDAIDLQSLEICKKSSNLEELKECRKMIVQEIVEFLSNSGNVDQK